MNGLLYTNFTLEQKSGFKLERNTDLAFNVIIIDIDWYEKNYHDRLLGHNRPALVQMYSDLLLLKFVLLC